MTSVPQQVEALAAINKLLRQAVIVYLFPQWRALVTQHGVMGKNAHDARIAAAMKAGGITDLVTFNKG